MTKVIKKFSNKLVKMELENMNALREFQQVQNRNINPQFGRHPLQFMQRERKDQDQIQPPLYVEEGTEEAMEENLKE